eukprot:TRINITY_DN4971_c0_g1_i4.p1 TRINITY_DN4971_c0_g1~~TRINITY_DN4971_c0_g1_i4.p1  ORF type:complete len:765 (-),score=45.33 TRINITY_DN4971_c0_g1_i4:1815-4109(-)
MNVCMKMSPFDKNIQRNRERFSQRTMLIIIATGFLVIIILMSQLTLLGKYVSVFGNSSEEDLADGDLIWIKANPNSSSSAPVGDKVDEDQQTKNFVETLIKQQTQQQQPQVQQLPSNPSQAQAQAQALLDLDEQDKNILNLQQVSTDYMSDEIDKNRLLAFRSTQSFAQHRMGIVSSVILAVISKRVLTISRDTFCVSGFSCNAQYVYDLDIFQKTLQEAGIQYQITDNEVDVETFQKFQCAQTFQVVCFQRFNSAHYTNRLFVLYPEMVAFPKDEIVKYKELMKTIFGGLVLSSQFQTLKDQIVTRIKLIGGFDKFNAIAIDKTLTQHDIISHTVVRQSNTTTEDAKVKLPYYMHAALQLYVKQFNQKNPIYISRSDLDPSHLNSLQNLTKILKANKFMFVIETPLFADVQLSDEHLHCINYFVNLEAEQFLGDGALVVNQLMVLERQLDGKKTSYFNEEILPLLDIYPVFTVPWIFTYNQWKQYQEYLVKAAVRSAIKVGKVTPFCLFLGERDSTIARWLQAMGVELIYHEPQWMAQLVVQNVEAIKHRDGHNYLFETPEELIANFLRMDIPLLPELSQYAFVLYTDIAVYFRKKVDLTELPLPLPETIGMGFLNSPSFPYGADISIMNMFGLRTNYEEFLKFVLSNKEMLNFPEYGSAISGAFNQFYKNNAKRWVMPQTYNGRPYYDFYDDTVIVHFQGPKPHDYHLYLSTNNCNAIQQDMCQNAVERGMCDYVIEWGQYVTDDYVSSELVNMCKTKRQVQ